MRCFQSEAAQKWASSEFYWVNQLIQFSDEARAEWLAEGHQKATFASAGSYYNKSSHFFFWNGLFQL